MSVRHIEEVIGWKQDDDGNVPWSPVWTTPGGRVRFDGAQVDDLAAWLTGACFGQVGQWFLEQYVVMGASRWHVSIPAAAIYTDDFPTILAALTAAVRNIAEARRREVAHETGATA